MWISIVDGVGAVKQCICNQSVWLYVQRQRTGVKKICSKYKKPVCLVLHAVH